MDVIVTATDDISQEGLFLQIALTESKIFWQTPNGINYHNQTFRHTFPYAPGTRIYISEEGEVVEHSETFFCTEPLVIENCEFVVFVQAYGTRDILQAAKSIFPKF